jgi:hypothetical protein
VRPDWRRALDAGPNARVKRLASATASGFVLHRIIDPLDAAVQADPLDAGLRAEAAYWCGIGWGLFARIPDAPAPADLSAMRGVMQEYSDQWTAQLQEGQRLDPFGKPSFWVLYEGRILFADQKIKPEEVANQRQMAARQLEAMILADPSDPRLRYLIVELLRSLKDASLSRTWRTEAERALELDLRAGSSKRCLTEEQHQQLKAWLAEKDQLPGQPDPLRRSDPSTDPAK